MVHIKFILSRIFCLKEILKILENPFGITHKLLFIGKFQGSAEDPS